MPETEFPSFELVVVEPFAGYEKGDVISDPDEVEALVDHPNIVKRASAA